MILDTHKERFRETSLFPASQNIEVQKDKHYKLERTVGKSLVTGYSYEHYLNNKNVSMLSDERIKTLKG